MTLLLVATLTGLMIAAQASAEGPVWFWFATCGGPSMTLEVRLDTTILFKVSFPLCRADRDAVTSQGQASNAQFLFRPHRAIVWQGYRDSGDRTGPNQLIKGHVWQAGTDPDAVAIGISFDDARMIYMNTIHIAHPGRRNETEIAKGLVVRTYPVERADNKPSVEDEA
jgi:hypothetical protein